MPAELPPTSGYTYAVELSVDEAISAQAKRVDFSIALPVYVDNFLGFPVGEIVPSGWYDRETSSWIASNNGKIIKIISIMDGKANLDSDGDGQADDSATLTALGVTTEEQEQLGSIYEAGKVVWRIPVTHFTPWDFNFPYGPPEDAEPPVDEEPEKDDEEDPKDPCEEKGCSIQAERRVLGQEFNIIGTPYSLHYSSDRVPGRKTGKSISIPLSGDTLPDSLKSIELEISVAGQKIIKSFAPQTALTYEFAWDGRDVYGREIKDEVYASIAVNYIYDYVYYSASQDFMRAFGAASQTPGTGGTLNAIGSRDTQQVKLSRRWTVPLGGNNLDYSKLGGLYIDVHNGLLPISHTLLKGDGSKRKLDFNGGEIKTVIGKGGSRWNYASPPPIEDGVDPLDVMFFYGRGMDVGPDGSIYIADDHRIVTVDPSGYVTSRFIDYEEHRNFPAFQIAVGNDGSIYGVTWSYNSVKKLAPDGTITVVAGIDGSQSGYSGDGGPATEALLNLPYDVDIASDGSIYIADLRNHAVRKISPDGIITTVYKGENDVFAVAVGNNGEFYVSMRNEGVVKVSKDGDIEQIVDGAVDPAILDLTVAKDGTLYMAYGDNKKVYSYKNGHLKLIAGGGENMGDKILALDAILG